MYYIYGLHMCIFHIFGIIYPSTNVITQGYIGSTVDLIRCLLDPIGSDWFPIGSSLDPWDSPRLSSWISY